MKLTKNKLLETIRRKNEGGTSYQARKIAGISVRRVDQIWRYYLQTGRMPEIGKNVGRPRRIIMEEERKMVRQSYEKYRVPASVLEKMIEREHSIHIPHNHIHKIMLEQGLAKPKKNKDVRKKKWIRYERRHSLTAAHIDWHLHSKPKVWVFAAIDDASRKLLALVEAKSPTTKASIEGMELALKSGQIKQTISGHDSQFVSNNGGKAKFKKYLKDKGIKMILCRIKHPQSNGKVEKFFGLYKAHRTHFETKQDFIKWYNEVRPHSSLNELETPEQAFIRKMKEED